MRDPDLDVNLGPALLVRVCCLCVLLVCVLVWVGLCVCVRCTCFFLWCDVRCAVIKAAVRYELGFHRRWPEITRSSGA